MAHPAEVYDTDTAFLLSDSADNAEGMFDFIAAPFKAVAHVASSAVRDIGGEIKKASRTISHVASDVGKGIGSAASFVGEQVGHQANLLPGFALAKHLLRGERIDRAFLGSIGDQLKSVDKLAPYAAMVVGFVPGVGSTIAAGITAGQALAHGKNITEAIVAGVRGMVPGGPLAAAAFDTGMALVQGKRIDEALLSAARNRLPLALRPAFDTGLAIAHGKNIQQAIGSGLEASVRALSPGIGATIADAVHAADDIAHGRLPVGAFINRIQGQLPNNRIIQDAFRTAKSVAGGESITGALLSQVRARIPGGVAQSAFDAGLAVAQGRNITSALLNVARGRIPKNNRLALDAFDTAVSLAQGQNVLDLAKKKLGGNMSNISRALGVSDPIGSLNRALASIPSPFSMLSPDISNVANAILRDPSLRSFTISELAKKLGSSESAAREGVAAIVRSAANMSSEGGLPRIARASEIASMLSPNMTIDQALARHAGRAAPVSFTSERKHYHQLPANVRNRLKGFRHGAPGFEDISGAEGFFSGLGSLGRIGNFRLPHHKKMVRGTPRHRDQRSAMARMWRFPIWGASGVATGGVDDTGVAYTVDSGDSPWKIAQKITGNGAKYKELAAANPKKSKDILAGKIFPGEHLALPPTWISPSEVPSAKPPATQPVAYAPTGPASPTSPISRSAMGVYIVAAGDSPWKIAAKLSGSGARYKELAAANPSHSKDILAGKIFPGERLTVPATWNAPGSAPSTSPGVSSPGMSQPGIFGGAQPTQASTSYSPSSSPGGGSQTTSYQTPGGATVTTLPSGETVTTLPTTVITEQAPSASPAKPPTSELQQMFGGGGDGGGGMLLLLAAGAAYFAFGMPKGNK